MAGTGPSASSSRLQVGIGLSPENSSSSSRGLPRPSMRAKWRRALELAPLSCVWSPQEQLWGGHPAPPSPRLLLQGEATPGETVLGVEPAVPKGLPRLTHPGPPPPI